MRGLIVAAVLFSGIGLIAAGLPFFGCFVFMVGFLMFQSSSIHENVSTS